MSNLAISLAEGLFGVLQGELRVGGVLVSALTKEYGTPCFVYDRSVMDRKLDALRAALPPRFTVCYSVKANPNSAILRHFLTRGCGLEIASSGEFCQAIQAGCPPERTLFAGPGKTEAELEFVLSRNVGEIHVESLVEAGRIVAISRRLGVRAKVAIRVNPIGEAEGGAMRMGGRSAPFGVDEEILGQVLDTLLAELFTGIETEPFFAGTQFLVEPGRFLVGEAGIYIARVNDIKISRGKKFLIVDGGMNHHLAASGNLGQTIKRNYPVALVNKLDMPAEEKVDVVGPLCTPLDTLARDISLPRAEIGDLIGIFQSGAYARSASPLGFLSHPPPPEIWVDNGTHILIRARGEFSDALRDPSLEFTTT